MHVMNEFIPKAGFPTWKASSPTAVSETNDELFELEVMPHCDALDRAAIALTMDSEDAEHLVRETLLKAYRLWHQIPPVDNVLAWLVSVLRHTFLNEYCSGRCAPAHTEMTEIDKFAVFGEVGGTNPAVIFFVFSEVQCLSAGGVHVVIAA